MTSPFSAQEFRSFPLVSVRDATPDCKIFRFALPTPDTPLALPIASCITVKFTDTDGKDVIRPYTPIDKSTDKGFFELAVKKYPGSKMGTHLFSLKVGDTLQAQGPWVTIPIKPNQYKTIGMIAGGTGITPMFQTINEVLCTEGNTTKIALLYASRHQDDILLHKELEQLRQKYGANFSIHYILSKPPADWKGSVGHITKELIAQTIPAPGADVKVLVSGPPGFMETITGPKGTFPEQGPLTGYMKDLGYPQEQVYKL